MSRYEEIMDHIEVTEEMRDRILTNIDREMHLAQGTHHRRKIRPATTWLPILAAAAVLFVVCSVALCIDRGNQTTSSSSGPSTQMESAATIAESNDADADLEASADAANATEHAEDSTDTTSAAAGKEAADSADGLEVVADSADADSASSGSMAAGAYWADEYDSAEPLSAAVGFEIGDLTTLPFTATETNYLAIGGDLAQISYYDTDGNEVCYRKSPGTEDNSGDYNDYEIVEDAAIGDHPLTLKYDGDLVHLATWTDGYYAYSISVSNGCSRDAMLTMIEEVR